MDILADVFITFQGITVLSPHERIEGESLQMSDEFSVATQDLCASIDADISFLGNRKGSFEITTVRKFKTPAQAALAMMEAHATWVGVAGEGVLAFLTTNSSLYRRAVISSRVVTVEKSTLKISYSFTLGSYLNSDEALSYR